MVSNGILWKKLSFKLRYFKSSKPSTIGVVVVVVVGSKKIFASNLNKLFPLKSSHWSDCKLLRLPAARWVMSFWCRINTSKDESRPRKLSISTREIRLKARSSCCSFSKWRQELAGSSFRSFPVNTNSRRERSKPLKASSETRIKGLAWIRKRYNP